MKILMQVPFLIFDISSGELILILLVALILFGPKQIPAIARSIGKGINELRKASDQIKNEVMQESEKINSQITSDVIIENNRGNKELINKTEEESIKPPENPLPPAG
jgi:TatA/E family protein of Tat protein translocase